MATPETVYCDNKFGVVSDQRIFYYDQIRPLFPFLLSQPVQNELPLDQVISARLDRQVITGIEMGILLLLVLIGIGGGLFLFDLDHMGMAALLLSCVGVQLAILSILRGSVSIILTVSGQQQPVNLRGYRWDLALANDYVDSIRAQKRSLQSGNSVLVRLLGAAKQSSGRLTTSQAVLETGLPFEDVEAQLQDMVQRGYVEAENDPETGTIRYWFFEL